MGVLGPITEADLIRGGMREAATWLRGADELAAGQRKLEVQADEAREAAVKAAGWVKNGEGYYHPRLDIGDDGVRFEEALRLTRTAVVMTGLLDDPGAIGAVRSTETQ